MNTEAQRLVAHAARDLDAAREMFEREEYVHVYSFCRNGLEKLLKANLVKRSPGIPAKGHGLVPLAALAGLSVPRREFMDLFTELTHFGEGETDPPGSGEGDTPVTRDAAQSVLRRSNDVYRWLSEVIG